MNPTIGIVAPSSPAPQIQLKLGVDRLEREGFAVNVHPQCRKQHLFFAGTDEERATAFLEYAYDPKIDVLWSARGGHGSIRLLQYLDKMTRTRGKPPIKRMIGYSDSTTLMEFARVRWGWSTLHGPMPTYRGFDRLPQAPTMTLADWKTLMNWIRGKDASAPKARLELWTRHGHKTALATTKAPIVGGNLTVLCTLLGTPFQQLHHEDFHDSFLFLEDIDEPFYRIDRMMQQLLLSGCLDKIRGILLGTFLRCHDSSPQVLARLNSSTATKPLRKTFSPKQALRAIFTEIGNSLQIPVVYGLPVGHGPRLAPLPLGQPLTLRTLAFNRASSRSS